MRPALWTASALAMGITAADWLRPHPVLALAAVAALAAWAVLDGNGSRRAALALLLTAAAFGALRYSYDQTAGRGNLSAWQGQKTIITATVTGEPELRKPRGVGYVATVEKVGIHPASGKVYVTQWGGKAPGFGERIVFTGTLKEPSGPGTPGAFDRAAYLARQGIYLVTETSGAEGKGPGSLNPLRKAAVATRMRLEAVLKATMPPRQAALTAGLLFGTRSDIPADIKDAFKVTGVFHLLAVSGGNIAMIVMPLLALMRLAGIHRRAAAAVAIPVVIFFVFLTGASPSVLRAGLMAVLVLLGDLLRRERNAINTLGAAVLLLLVWHPGILFDLGFQLSAVATLGILLFARRIERWLAPRLATILAGRSSRTALGHLPRSQPPRASAGGTWRDRYGAKGGEWLAAGLSVTLAAQVLVEPISLHNFGAFSAVAPLANLLVLAFLDPVVKVGTVAVLVGVAVPAAAWALNLAVRLGLWLLIFVVKVTAAIPGAYLEPGRIAGLWVAVWYGALTVIAVPRLRDAMLEWARRTAVWWRSSPGSARRLAAACVLLALAGGWTWRLALAAPPDTLRVTFLDVGQGDAILVEAPGDRTLLIDAGDATPPEPAKNRIGFDAGAEVILPHLAREGIRRLDMIILTHPHQDHAGGFPAVLEKVSVGLILDTAFEHDAPGYHDTLSAAARKRIPIRRPVAGERILLGEVVLEVLHPGDRPLTGTRSDENSNSIVIRLVYRQVAMLLTGDVEAAVEELLVAGPAPLRADLLKVAHHGSDHSSTAAFLRAVSPRWAVISAGNGNSFGHPHPATLERLQAAGAEIYRTDRHGSIVARTDGYSVSMSSARGRPADEQYRPIGLLKRRLISAW